MMTFLEDFFSSLAADSKLLKPARGSCLLSARLSSLFGSAGAVISSATGEALIGSTLATTGKDARVLGDAAGLMTTGGGWIGAAAEVTGLGMVTEAGGRAGSGCTPSSFALRSFCNRIEIWSAMVFKTATCVMVKACAVGAKTA